jgi:hypothetical protein
MHVMKSFFHKLFSWVSGEPAPKPKEQDSPPKVDWRAIEADREKWVDRYKKMMKPRGDGLYDHICLGEYPEESDEVWVETWSGEPGVRHDDLAGWVVLSDCRRDDL